MIYINNVFIILKILWKKTITVSLDYIIILKVLLCNCRRVCGKKYPPGILHALLKAYQANY